MKDPLATVLDAISAQGLLLLQDKELPNVVTFLTGEKLRTSWWSHAKGSLIFEVVTRLAEHPDVLVTKLLGAKVTFVHRTLWPALLSVASAGEAWQREGLSAAASRLLAAAEDARSTTSSSGPAVKELEARLLAHTQEVHSESGRHEIRVEPWGVWARRAGVKPLRSVDAAKRQIEEAVRALGAKDTLLPWRRYRTVH